MSTTQKRQRTFVAVTMITVIAITMVFAVYAALLKSYTGGIVTIQTIGGSVQYSLDNSTSWAGTLTQGAGAEWYSRISITNPPTQDVTVSWTLRTNSTGTWEIVSTDCPTTAISLSPSTQYIYASSDGLSTANHDWGTHTTTNGFYRLDADINTA